MPRPWTTLGLSDNFFKLKVISENARHYKQEGGRVDSFRSVWVILPNFWPNFEELECYSRTKWFQGLSQQTEDIRERPPAFWPAGARWLEASDIYPQHTSLTPFSFNRSSYTHTQSLQICAAPPTNNSEV